MKLYYSHNSNPRLAVAVARYCNAPVEFVFANPTDPAQKAFYAPLNPNRRVPILVEANRPPLWEADAIAARLCQITGSDLWPAPEHLPDLLKWLSWTHDHFGPPCSAFYFENIVKPTFTDHREPPEVMASHMRDFRHYARLLDKMLKGHRWLIADKPSYADFRVAFVLPYAAKAGLPLSDYPEVQRLSDQLDELEAWRDPFKGFA
ncbi:MAG: glutathione S-transferase family protein [Paracoccaceae bacterium]